jgi:hypothetical protein
MICLDNVSQRWIFWRLEGVNKCLMVIDLSELFMVRAGEKPTA